LTRGALVLTAGARRACALGRGRIVSPGAAAGATRRRGRGVSARATGVIRGRTSWTVIPLEKEKSKRE
jgi:hypothetical protein